MFRVIWKMAGIICALGMIMLTVVVSVAQFVELGWSLAFFLVLSTLTFSLLTMGSVVVAICFYVDEKWGLFK